MSIVGLIGGCNTVTPIDPNGAYIFRDESPAPTKCPQGGQSTYLASTPNQSIKPKKSKTSWLGSSRDPNSTVPKETTPLISSSRDISELVLGPCDPVARIGTQVIMVAGVKDKSGKFRKNMQVQWNIDSSTPGGFVNIDRRDWEDIFAGEWEAPHIESSYLAYTSTSRKAVRLTKGTPSTKDDVFIHEGQTWAMVGSNCEGTTRLTAIATDSADWQNRIKAANIHWIDAWPVLPPSKIAQSYNQPLTIQTGVYKYNGNVAPGCIVVYEILDNTNDTYFKIPSANSTSTDSNIDSNTALKNVTVPIDDRGLCEIQLVRKSQNSGQTRFRTTVIRDNADGRFTVPIRLAQSETVVDWGETGLQVAKTGPTILQGGTEASYRIAVRNVNSEPINQIVVTDNVPDSFEYLRSSPTGRIADAFTTATTGQRIQQIQWTIPTLNAGETLNFDVVYRVTQEGDYHLLSVAKAGNVTAEDIVRTRVDSSCARTQMSPTPACMNGGTNGLQPLANLDIQIVCQDRAHIGDNIILHAYVKNNGTDTITQTNATVSYSAGLSCPFGASPIQLKPLGSIASNQTRDISINFKATTSGRQVITMEFVTDSNQRFTRQVFVTIDGNDASNLDLIPPPQSDNTTQSPSSNTSGNEPNSILNSQTQPDTSSATDIQAEQPKNNFSVDVVAPQTAKTGEQFEIVIKISNLSNNPMDKILISCQLDNNLELLQSTEGSIKEANNKVNWNIDSIPARSIDIYTMVVSAKTPMTTLSRIVVTKDNVNLTEKECVVEISGSENKTETDSVQNTNDVPVPELVPSTNIPTGTPEQPTTPTNTESKEDSNFVSPAVTPLDLPTEPLEQVNNKLKIELTSSINPVKVNQELTCQLKITNTTSNVMNNVSSFFFIHNESFQLVESGTNGDTKYTYDSSNGKITFSPATILEPGKTLNYNIRLLPKQAGAISLSSTTTASENGIENISQDTHFEINVEQ